MQGFDLYRDNVALLYRHFDEYKTKSRFFMSPLPFEVRYELSIERKKTLTVLNPVQSPIPLGALFLGWRQYPELFKIETANGEAMIFSFNGSPLSGANCYSAVNLKTGEIVQGNNAPGFMKRCAALNDAINITKEMVKEMCQRKSMNPKEFQPAPLEEVIEFVRELEKA